MDENKEGAAHENASLLANALSRAPWWVLVVFQLGVPNVITLASVGVVLGLIPSPHLMEKFKTMEEGHAKVLQAIEEGTEVNREQTEVLRSIKTCMRHPEWKSCE